MANKIQKYYIRQAKGYDTCVAGLLIPKNAVYGRDDRTFFYIIDFQQFRENKLKYEIYLMTMSDNKYRKVHMIKKNPIMRMVIEYIDGNNLYDTKCEFHQGISIEKLFKQSCQGNNAVNSYKSVKKPYYDNGWFRRT